VERFRTYGTEEEFEKILLDYVAKKILKTVQNFGTGTSTGTGINITGTMVIIGEYFY
jgi:hypothetical protein